MKTLVIVRDSETGDTAWSEPAESTTMRDLITQQMDVADRWAQNWFPGGVASDSVTGLVLCGTEGYQVLVVLDE